MEGHLLRKGANVSLLSRNDPSARLQAVVRWADPRGAADVDVSALLLGPDGRVRSDADFVFYNAPSGGDGSVRLLGKRADDEAGEDRVAVDLEALPPDIERVVIAASLDAGEGVGFGALPELGLVLLDAEGSPSVRFDVDDVGPETAIVLGELYSRGEDWKFRAVGQGWDTGLAGLATDFGISVASEPSEDPPSGADAPVHEVPPVVAPPAEEPAADLVEVPVDDIGVDELVAGESWVATEAATESAPQQRGVRTRKKRTLVTSVAPPALAESASWHPARLFSITGVGTAREQEQRATSTLLSSMMAVRDFGRALVGRFGGPAGAIEAYPEVPFTMADGTTVRPDGVIRVARGGRTWTALLETKTGTNGHRVEQVERYLDLARQQEYQAVVTLSNELTPVGGAHPVAVDKRKTQKVALHHIAWSEVLHEAQMQLAHRGVADRLQAWLLAELIRYLEHPRSGAAGFDDMGPSWVAVRDAVVARTLRPTDHKVGSVTTSWDRLMRHICLRLTHEHGTNFSPAHPARARRQPGGPRASGRDAARERGHAVDHPSEPAHSGPPDDHRGPADGADPHGAGHRCAPGRRPEQAPQLAAAPTGLRARLDDGRSGVRPPRADRLRAAEGRSVEPRTLAAACVGRGPELPHRACAHRWVPSGAARSRRSCPASTPPSTRSTSRSCRRCARRPGPEPRRDARPRARRWIMIVRHAEKPTKANEPARRPAGRRPRPAFAQRPGLDAGGRAGGAVRPAARRAQGRSAAAGRDLRLGPRRRREPPTGADRHAAGRAAGAAHPPTPRVGDEEELAASSRSTRRNPRGVAPRGDPGHRPVARGRATSRRSGRTTGSTSSGRSPATAPAGGSAQVPQLLLAGDRPDPIG